MSGTGGPGPDAVIADLSREAMECHRAGRLEAAVDLYRRLLIRLTEGSEQRAVIHFNAGAALQALGRTGEALADYREAIRLRPDFAEGQFNLGLLLVQTRAFREAAEAVRRSLALRPDLAMAHHLLGLAQTGLGDHAGAFASFRLAAHLEPNEAHLWDSWADCLTYHGIPDSVADARLLDDLARVLERPGVRPQAVGHPIWRALDRLTAFGEISGQLREGQTPAFADVASRLSAIPLLLRMLAISLTPLPAAERTLTALRRMLLTAAVEGTVTVTGLPFAAALAAQCFLNEYVFAETAEEAAAVERLTEEIATAARQSSPSDPARLAALACYRPLHRLEFADALVGRTWPEPLARVIAAQISEPRAEEALKPTIPRLTPIGSGVSDRVRAMYEANPFPRWVKPVRTNAPRPAVDVLGDLLPQLGAAERAVADAPEILIAGCGTGLNAIYVAAQFANARVLAIDLSLSSLAYAVRKSRELGLGNLTYGQADILQLRSLGRQFDLIDSMGVLHHLAEPLAGWRVLVDLLRPRGLMRIGLYSELGRRGVVRAREIIAGRAIADTPEAMRAFRQEILAADPKREPDLARLVYASIYSMSELRDLIFHVQEHRYTLSQIASALNELGLEFLGFELPPEALRLFRERYPAAADIVSLERWDEFEHAHPAVFAGMYQLWCRKVQRTGG